MRITVFTPTYNRGYIIDNLYQSLKRQSFRDFEWIVVDDGSTDDTAEQFQRYLSEDNGFSIRYVRVENGGKHRAINRGVQMATGELFFIVDSDDYLIDHSLETIDRVERTLSVEEKERFAGVCGLRGYSQDVKVGKTFQGNVLDITSLERSHYGISGDKAEVFYTEVLRKYPFPQFDNEKFLTECVVWDKIAHDGYKLRFFNEIVYVCDYLPDGLTAHYDQLYHNTPKGYGLYISQSVKFGKITGMAKWNEYLQYYYEFKTRMHFSEIAKNLQVNPVMLYIRLFGMRLFYRLYR